MAPSSPDADASPLALAALLRTFQPESERVLQHLFPSKIAELTSRIHHYASQPLPVTTFSNDSTSVPLNVGIIELIQEVKGEINQLLELLDPVRVHISLQIPKMSDQKGTAVTTKEELVELLSSARASGQSVLDSISRYHQGRGKLVSKRLKFPQAKDWEENIREVDRKEYTQLTAMLADLRGNYAILYDYSTKNKAKLEPELTTHSYEHMY